MYKVQTVVLGIRPPPPIGGTVLMAHLKAGDAGLRGPQGLRGWLRHLPEQLFIATLPFLKCLGKSLAVTKHFPESCPSWRLVSLSETPDLSAPARQDSKHNSGIISSNTLTL